MRTRKVYVYVSIMIKNKIDIKIFINIVFIFLLISIFFMIPQPKFIGIQLILTDLVPLEKSSLRHARTAARWFLPHYVVWHC